MVHILSAIQKLLKMKREWLSYLSNLVFQVELRLMLLQKLLDPSMKVEN